MDRQRPRGGTTGERGSAPDATDAPPPQGTGVQAVRTTGIYCKPGCTARPDPANVIGYPLAATAEAAGFRPCHRCRPYRDDPVGVIGPDLVCRAVHMITDGALNGHSEADLASALGVSARHLRRVFDRHLGVTPDGLARSHRAHFARRLLDDTDLSVRDTAFAAGFGSVRQFQRAMVRTFGESPTALRARRPGRRSIGVSAVRDRAFSGGDGAEPTMGPDGGLTLYLHHEGPLDWWAMGTWLGARAVAGVEAIAGDGSAPDTPVMRRTVDLGGEAGVSGEAGLVELGRDPTTQRMFLTAHLPWWDGLAHTVSRAQRVIAIWSPVTDAIDALGADPLLGGLVRQHPGLRPPGCWDPFETTARAVLAQQVSTTAARTLAARLVAKFGTPVEGLSQLGLNRTFPRPELLAEADLGGIGLTSARAATLRAVSVAVLSGSRDVLDARIASDTRARSEQATGHDPGPPRNTYAWDEVRERLQSVRGIGPWTAGYVAMRMGSPDEFPASDLALRDTVALLGRTPRPTPGEMEAMSHRWRPYRSFAAIHLWWALAQLRRRAPGDD